MHALSSNTKRFLYAAQQAELKALRQLSENCQLVAVICDVIHEFQKERGVSNVYLASIGTHYPIKRNGQIQHSKNALNRLMEILNQNYLDSMQNTNNHRFLFSITLSLQCIDNLASLRKSVEHHKVTPLESTQAYCRFIGSLICIIFEATDISSDTLVTRHLVALFNFIQAKEHAGQERAWGAIGFAESRFTDKICASLHHLQEAQNSSIDVFMKYTNTQHQSAWKTLSEHKVSNEVAKFRQLIAQLSGGDPVSSDISEVWYELATQRIDQMHIIEKSLSQALLSVSITRVDESKVVLKSAKSEMNGLKYLASKPESPHTIMYKGQTSEFFGMDNDDGTSICGSDITRKASNSQSKPQETHLHKSLYDLLMKQAQRIEEMSDELDIAKQSLSEQKIVSRAKLLLIQQLQLSETDAHKKMQQSSMQQGLSIAELAENIINASKGEFISKK